MKLLRIFAACGLAASCTASAAEARLWTDSTGKYSVEADLVAFNDKTVVLQRANHELVAVPLDQLSEKDRQYLQSKDAADLAQRTADDMQTWTLRDGTKITGHVVSYASGNMTIQRRRGRIYINDRVLDNLPEFYQQLVPKIVAKFENLQQADRRHLEAWLVRQRGQLRTFPLEGVILESENGDEFILPFFLLSESDLSVLQPGWNEWLAARDGNDYDGQNDNEFLLRSLAAARFHNQRIQREIALMHLQLQGVQAGLTSLWEVTLYPAAGQGSPPRWVVVPARDSRDATISAMQQFRGYVAGPVRRVAGG